jgi:hypothetical protein
MFRKVLRQNLGDMLHLLGEEAGIWQPKLTLLFQLVNPLIISGIWPWSGSGG